MSFSFHHISTTLANYVKDQLDQEQKLLNIHIANGRCKTPHTNNVN